MLRSAKVQILTPAALQEVFLDRSTYARPPGRFEAGTPAIAECVGLGAACDYLSSIGMDKVHEHERYMTGLLWDTLGSISRTHDLTLLGPPPDTPAGAGRAALAAFNVKGIQAGDLATFLDMEGVAIRAGHHCAQPLHRSLGACLASAKVFAY